MQLTPHARMAKRVAFFGAIAIIAMFFGLSYALRGEVLKPFMFGGIAMAMLHFILFTALAVSFNQPIDAPGPEDYPDPEESDEIH